MLFLPTPKPAEYLHTKDCLARAIINAVENIRDYEGTDDLDFRQAAQSNDFLTIAEGYLSDCMIECTQKCDDNFMRAFRDDVVYTDMILPEYHENNL